MAILYTGVLLKKRVCGADVASVFAMLADLVRQCLMNLELNGFVKGHEFTRAENG
jgi:hypothetical protein